MTSSSEDAFSKLAVDHWRLIRVLARLVDRLPQESQARVAAQARFAGSQLDSLVKDQGLSLVTFEGRAFDPSLPVTAVNADDFVGASALLVSETVEPTVMADGRVIQLGKVLVSQGGVDASRN
ncbi:hypothetical protein [uncultured Phenylobacterium sp.]|uniref:hypothetical protein n=1 Tax=uncultured Phenylobacterium sp. TaxID=349273 RepID=UPI0025F44CAA|nr:hypothetical protein [uncultured Phenylobacterium sp.]